MPARPHSAVTSAKPPRIHAPRTSHDDVFALVIRNQKRFGCLRSATNSTPVIAVNRPASTAGTTPAAARSSACPRATSNAATSIAPAAMAFVTRYADTFVPHVAGCAVVYVVRAAISSGEWSAIVAVIVEWPGVVSAQIIPSGRIIVRVGSSAACDTPR